MKQSYDWDSNILDFKDINGNHFRLELRGDKTIVLGDSATGKTLICARLKGFIDDMNTNMKPYGADNIFVLTKDNRDKLSEQSGKLIVIDRAELLLTEDMVKLINQDMGINRYLIFLRKPLGIEVSPNHFGELYRDQETDTVKLRYAFDIKGWC